MSTPSIARIRDSFRAFPRLSGANISPRTQVGACLILGGSNREHIGELVSIISSTAKSIDIVLSMVKTEGFRVSRSVNCRVLVFEGADNISKEGLSRADLRAHYDSIFFVVNNHYGIGYRNFLEIKDSLFPNAKSFFFNIARKFLYDAPSNRKVIYSFESMFDTDDVAQVISNKSRDIINVLIDASLVTTGGRTGIENYTLRMLEALDKIKGVRVFALCQDKALLRHTNVECIFFDFSHALSKTDARLKQVIDVFDIDLFISPYRAISIGLRCVTVLVVHDLIPILFPDFFETDATYRYFDARIRSSCEHVNLVITVSQSTSRDVIDLLGVPSIRVKTVYPGPGTAVSLNPVRPHGLNPVGKEAFILYNGTIEPRKGVAYLLSAYRMLRHEYERLQRPPPYLVLSGKFGWDCDAERELINKMSLSGVLHLGYVQDEELIYLYQSASLFVFPSTYEGFGLPILEAFTFGLPVLTFNNSSLSEIGEEAAYFAESQDALGLFQALLFLLQSPRELERLRGKGFERARQFSWDHYQSELCLIFKELFPNKSIE